LHQIISDGDIKKYYESLLLIQESAAKYKNPKGLILPNGRPIFMSKSRLGLKA
jgi:hypothetical protein